jgi:YHS domain-containing protein
MQRIARNTARAAVIGLGLMSPALAQNTSQSDTPAATLTTVSGQPIMLKDLTTPYAAFHFGPVDTGELSRRAATMPGLMHLVVSAGGGGHGDASPLVAFIRDGGGPLASRFKADATRPLVVIVDRAGAEVVRVEGDTGAAAVRERYAAATRGEPDRYNLPKDRLAIEGYDPVAYFDPGKPAKGSERITAEFRGAVYRFASEESRLRFAQDPERYAPTYGGWCASAMAYKGGKVGIDPKNFKVKDGRLHLFYKSVFADALKDWNKNEKAWEPLADANWQKLTGEPARIPER